MGRVSLTRKSINLLLLVLPALIFYAMHRKAPQSIENTLFREPVLALQKAYDKVSHSFSVLAYDYIFLTNTRKTNQSLKAENRELKALAMRFNEVQLENTRLAQILDFKSKLDRPSVPARVIGHDILNSQRSVVVDKGRKHGVKRLQAVISPNGVVGSVISVGQWTSRVLLINDRSSNVDATIQRTRSRGILSGYTKSKVRMKYLMREDDLSQGDMVVTSGRQGFFPPGLVIGKVEKVFPSRSAVSFEATVQPAVELHRLEEVLILAETSPEEGDNDADREQPDKDVALNGTGEQPSQSKK